MSNVTPLAGKSKWYSQQYAVKSHTSFMVMESSNEERIYFTEVCSHN
jgi:hypothetical protein